MNRNILFIDDEPLVLNALYREFIRTPYLVHTFDDPKQAIDALEMIEPAVVVSDYRMGDMDGICLLEYVKRRWPYTIRMILSGQGDFGTAIEAVNRGNIFRYVQKPWNARKLREHLDEALAVYNNKNGLKKERSPAYGETTGGRQRLVGAKQIAAAVCHEIGQPLHVINGWMKIIMDNTDVHNPGYSQLATIQNQTKRMATVLDHLRNIKRYRTKPYPGGIRIFDIQKSSGKRKGSTPTQSRMNH